ncbi:hypothetical protein XcuCFBP2542_07800 [Xanthomonas cucurbitae]|uniref:Uncharacterized protein n=1 Tax=Xanthomonas cucurbitae TaxID=56453 RepID=A0A2S7DT38_9XANT|nr:hypothetical protein XcuCFBP2542_07800 [Xanthomonas cucurbitae]QHG87775.1 hypothetical protein EBN15_13345 [Xanthomonas cucurbitae]
MYTVNSNTHHRHPARRARRTHRHRPPPVRQLKIFLAATALPASHQWKCANLSRALIAMHASMRVRDKVSGAIDCNVEACRSGARSARTASSQTTHPAIALQARIGNATGTRRNA